MENTERAVYFPVSEVIEETEIIKIMNKRLRELRLWHEGALERLAKREKLSLEKVVENFDEIIRAENMSIPTQSLFTVSNRQA